MCAQYYCFSRHEEHPTSYSDIFALKAQLAIEMPAVWKVFHFFMTVFLSNCLPKKSSIGLHGLIAQITFSFYMAELYIGRCVFLANEKYWWLSLSLVENVTNQGKRKHWTAPSFCHFLFSFNIQTVQISPPPILMLKRKRSAGVPLNPFSVQSQTPKVMEKNQKTSH